MAQLYFKDSGMLVHEGLTEAQYRSQKDFKDQIHGIANTRQVFEEARVPKRQVHFYVASLDKFFLRQKQETHAILEGAKTQFNATRFDEMMEKIEELGPLASYFDSLDFPKIKRKLNRAQQLGIITTAELNTLTDLI